MADDKPMPTRAQQRRALGLAILLGGVAQGRTVNGRLGPRGARKSAPRKKKRKSK